MASQLSQDSLDNLIAPPENSEPGTPDTTHSDTIAVTVPPRRQAQKTDDARIRMTPPPSTQVPPSSRAKARTPTPPVSQISTPPPTIELQGLAGRSTGAYTRNMSSEELEAASPEDLKTKVAELQTAVQQEKMQAAHYKLQYNMLSQESAAAIERMAVEARMAQTENDVIAHAEQSRIPVTPLPQQEGFIPVQKALYQRMIRDIQILRETNQVLERENKDQEKTLAMQDDEIASLRDRITLMGERIRQSREQQQRSRRPQYFSARVDATPRSVYNTPQRPHISNRQQQPQAFAALIQASEMASQESARSASKKGHSKNMHSTSSLPSTPQRSQKVQQPYQTPSGRQQPRKIPSTAPVARTSAIRTPDVYAQSSLPMSQTQDPQSDGTVSASDNDSEAETDILDQNDEIPESQASLSASQMLRSSQEHQSKRESFEGRGMLEPSNRGGDKLRQTKLFGQVRKSNVVRAGYDDDEPPAKRPRTGESGIGLGISGTRE